jgi:Ca-activated chloride channel homolog
MFEMIFQSPLYLILLALLPASFLIYNRFAGRRRDGESRGSATAERTTAYRRGNRFAVLAARLLTLLLLVLALAGPAIPETTERVNVVYVIDRSMSLPEIGQRPTIEYLNESLALRHEDDTVGIVVFGGDSSVEASARRELTEVAIESVVDDSATDIANAIYTAMSIMPEYGDKRIVLLSDGNENRGDALEAAQIAKASGIRITTVPLTFENVVNEAYVRDIITPMSVRSGQIFEFTVAVRSTMETPASLTFALDGNYIGEEEVALQPGENSFSYTTVLEDTGVHRYEVRLSPGSDVIAENNLYQAVVRVSGRPAILYVSAEGKRSESLLNALNVQEFTVDAVDINELPATLGELIGYDAILFDNIPAFDLSITKMELIERYVRDTGGGFVMIGGDQSFGVGGYYKTPIEKVLPVDMDVTSSMYLPSLALVMAVDKSGSMGEQSRTTGTKLDIVKEAVIAAVDILNPYYTVGLLAFDADFEWTVPITQAGNRAEIIDRLSRLRSGGGTDLFNALKEGYSRLLNTPAAVKHLIALSDGLTDVGDFEGLTKAIAQDGISVSTVAVGEDANRQLMRQIAGWGGGRSYYTDDISNAPRIFASESMIVSRDLIVEESFLPAVTADHETIKGVGLEGFPPLHGFVLTYNKPGAEQVLSTFNNSPLLSVWRYGLGRSAAFTSDLKGRWGTEWVRWDEFPQFIAQLMRWSERPKDERELDVAISHAEGRGTVRVDAVTPDGAFLNNLELQAVMIRPDAGAAIDRDLEGKTVSFTQDAPGLYSLEFETGEAGEYYFTIFDEDGSLSPETYGMVIPYPEEYVQFEPNLELLEAVAEATDDRMVRMADTTADFFEPTGIGTRIYRSLWFWFALAALILFVLDIAIRQVRIPPGFFQRIANIFRAKGDKLSYDEAAIIIAERYREERERKRDITYWFGRTRDNRDYAARLYLAKRRQKK